MKISDFQAAINENSFFYRGKFIDKKTLEFSAFLDCLFPDETFVGVTFILNGKFKFLPQ
jgi:hypothetical protein